MRKHNTTWLVLFWTLVLVLISTVSVAQSEKQSAEDTEQTGASEESPDFVYTTDYLKKRLAESEQQATGVTNKTLDEQYAEPAEASDAAFTNDDLEGAESSGGEAPAVEEAAEPAAETEPTEPAMSDEDRAALIAELEAKIGELQQQLDELRKE